MSEISGSAELKEITLQGVDTIDLKKEFPITWRRGFKKSFWRMAIFLSSIACTVIFDSYLSESIESDFRRDLVELGLITANLFLGLWWLYRFVEYQVERYSYEYKIRGGNLYISKGLITKSKGSFPLDRITDIYLHRGMGDFFWGLSSLIISTPTESSSEFACIHGLTIRGAEKFRERLEHLVKAHQTKMEGMANDLQAMIAEKR